MGFNFLNHLNERLYKTDLSEYACCGDSLAIGPGEYSVMGQSSTPNGIYMPMVMSFPVSSIENRVHPDFLLTHCYIDNVLDVTLPYILALSRDTIIEVNADIYDYDDEDDEDEFF